MWPSLWVTFLEGTDADGQVACWAEYFEQLFKVNPPSW